MRSSTKTRSCKAFVALMVLTSALTVNMVLTSTNKPQEEEPVVTVAPAQVVTYTTISPKATEENSHPIRHSESDLYALAKLVWGESRGLSKEEQELTVWCVLNRVDSTDPDFEDQNSIMAVVTHPNAFHGYNPNNPVEEDILSLVEECVEDWEHGEQCPTHPTYAPNEGYLFFYGDGSHNWYRNTWR